MNLSLFPEIRACGSGHPHGIAADALGERTPGQVGVASAAIRSSRPADRLTAPAWSAELLDDLVGRHHGARDQAEVDLGGVGGRPSEAGGRVTDDHHVKAVLDRVAQVGIQAEVAAMPARTIVWMSRWRS